MTRARTQIMAGWGNYPRQSSLVSVPHTINDMTACLTKSTGWVARGNGRSYGDAAVGVVKTVKMQNLNRFCAFDPETGHLTVEAGALLSDVIETFLPLGFFPYVVPGTKFVTVGGMVASDVHGKNHHSEGGFGHFVEALTLLLNTGEVLTCSKQQNAEVFEATIGGMGLTGTILTVTFRLRRVETGWIKQRVSVANTLGEAFDKLQEGRQATYSVAWIDCLAKGAVLGRSLIYDGEHATLGEINDAETKKAELFPTDQRTGLTVPRGIPNFVLNHYSVRAFNGLYYRRGRFGAQNNHLTDWDSYFFPLDGVHHWNRMYGSKGFVQFQCVLPFESAYDAVKNILTQTSNTGSGSFLGVLKTLGQGAGTMSFARPGVTLALDFPVSDKTFKLLTALDNIVATAGGRIYLAKDAVQSKAVFQKGYADALTKFQTIRKELGVLSTIQSYQSKRLGI